MIEALLQRGTHMTIGIVGIVVLILVVLLIVFLVRRV